MDSYVIFSNGILKLLRSLNKVTLEDALARGCQPFFVDNKQVGLIRPDFWKYLKNYTDVLYLVDPDLNKPSNNKKAGIHLSPNFQTYEERTTAVGNMLEDLRKKDVIPALRGWRHENYKVSQRYTDTALLEIERACSGLFGVIQYGIHVNGYMRDKDGQIMMWIGRRSKTKQTFPDMYDNMCAGGLSADLGVLECVKKECKEEASVSDDILDGLKFVGTMSYFYEDERGLFPECQFIYDLELPNDFRPVNADGEVASFQLFTMNEVKNLIVEENFKPNCAAICLEFLIRHGLLDADADPNVSLYVEQLHTPLQTYYAGR
ncbi:unnamed protein product [Lymnaea stagnalis]|uniref:Nudix hydrolase domain-containing protein n=1 Tax=Lymnaea stagnalis TaxID=6523 RepID=A0AAV2I1F9_LYMST